MAVQVQVREQDDCSEVRPEPCVADDHDTHASAQQVDILGREDPVTIRITESTPMAEIKKQLAAVTGIPAKDQKLLLSGIDRLTMGSRKTNLRFGSCGTADSISFAVKTK